MTWHALVEGERRDVALRTAAAIFDAVATRATNEADLAIALGYAGREARATAVLEAAIPTFVTRPHPGVWGGASGVAWAIAHATDDAELLAEADRFFMLLVRDRWSGLYDLVGGLVGIGVYALERGEAGHALARRVLDQLEALAQPRATGIAWFTRASALPDWQRAVAPEGYDNLGVAHGIPGVIALLSRFAAFEPARAHALVAPAIDYLFSITTPTPRGRFPRWSTGGDPARVGWCYGDLGVALALVSAGDAFGRATWIDAGLALARATTTRDRDDVIDAGLCHGAAGNCHIFNRLWQATGDASMHDTALAWFDRITTFEPPEQLDVLDGTAGIGLALLAAATDAVEPRWDRLLLADLPTRRSCGRSS